jgi:uncharacterized membrane protein YkvA (DUF1232 family)
VSYFLLNKEYFFMQTKAFDSTDSEGLFAWVIKGGKAVALQGLTLYFTMMDRRTPLWAKTAIAAALGYAIMPLDLVPDMIPVLGLADDAAVLASALLTVAVHIEAEHQDSAQKKIDTLFS